MPDSPTPSGQFRVRLPADLHGAVSEKAEQQGVSMNTLIIAALAGYVGWKLLTGGDEPNADDLKAVAESVRPGS